MENFEVFVYDIPKNVQVNGLLGMDFLKQTKAVISIDNEEVYFKILATCKFVFLLFLKYMVQRSADRVK